MKFAAASIFLLAAALRVPGLTTDFWLDEIWALDNVASLDSASGVFTGIHHDSNHWLVSLWMLALGRDEPFWLYRLPSLIAGVAFVLAAGWLSEITTGRKTLAMFLAAASFPLGFYASEARGYSLAACAALLSAAALVRWVDARERRWLVLYALSATTGVLSHLSFLIVLLAAVFFTTVLALRGRLSLSASLLVHAAPFGVLAGLFFVDLRYLALGGGPSAPPWEVLVQTASLALGGPVEHPVEVFFAALCAGVLGAELVRQTHRFWRSRESTEPRHLLWLFLAPVLLLPAWIALVLDPPFLFPRYFLVSIAFVPVLVASFASALGRPLGAVFVSVYLVANAGAWVRFASEGRGRYEEALQAILTAAPVGTIAVGSDNDFRTEKIVSFYRERMGGEGERIRYVRSEADFLITEDAKAAPESWVLLSSYPSSTLSGARWDVYRRLPATPDRSTSSPDP